MCRLDKKPSYFRMSKRRALAASIADMNLFLLSAGQDQYFWD